MSSMRIPQAPARWQPRRLAQAALLLCVGFGVAFCEHVALARPDATGPSAEEVRAALKAFDRSIRSKDPAARIEALRTLGCVRHEKVAFRLLKHVKREKHDPVLATTFEALGKQTEPRKKILSALTRRLDTEIRIEDERIRRGKPNFRVDPRTEEADIEGPEGRAHLEATAERAAMVRALLEALHALEWQPDGKQPDLTRFLQDPGDDLVVTVLGQLGRWQAWPALPAIEWLFRMYPAAQLWETGAVHQAGGTDATAKAEWLMLFGHPDKQRARPKVHAALIAALKAITGETFDSPEALGAYLKRSDVKARIAGKRPKR